MNIKNKHYHTIWLHENGVKVEIIDQRKLPFLFEVEELTSVEDVFIAIKDMHVRGAPLIGVTAAYGMYIAALNAPDQGISEYMHDMADYLNNARPTAVNLSYAISLQLNAINQISTKNELIKKTLEVANQLKKQEIDSCKKIGRHGVDIIKQISEQKQGKPVNILTHCNAGWLACVDYGTATAPIYEAYEQNIPIHVWVDETRPRNQGASLTAFELTEQGISHAVICDNTGGHLMQHGMVDIVITGSDRTTANGDVCNKIGTYLKALAAFDNNIPFYVALPSSTIDWNITNGLKEIVIEERDEEEVKYIKGFVNGRIETVRLTPETTPCANYAFDVTPGRLVTGLITEKGVCEATQDSISQLFEK